MVSSDGGRGKGNNSRLDCACCDTAAATRQRASVLGWRRRRCWCCEAKEHDTTTRRRRARGRRRRRLGREARAAAAGQQVFSKLARSSIATRESDGQRSSSSSLCQSPGKRRLMALGRRGEQTPVQSLGHAVADPASAERPGRPTQSSH